MNIEQAAENYAGDKCPSCNDRGSYESCQCGRLKAAFIAGAKYAGEWISVAERLPEPGQCLITYFNPSDQYKKFYVIPCFRGRNGWYYDNYERENAEDSTLTVTHWQPLPQAPKLK